MRLLFIALIVLAPIFTAADPTVATSVEPGFLPALDKLPGNTILGVMAMYWLRDANQKNAQNFEARIEETKQTTEVLKSLYKEQVDVLRSVIERLMKDGD